MAERAEASEKPNPTNVGGQAVIEGVMMRAPGALSVVCRRADGSLMLRERSVPLATSFFAKTPFLRGIHTLVSSVRIGHQALQWSASLMEEDLIAQEQAEADAKKAAAKAKKGSSAASALASVTLALHALNAFLLSPLDEPPDAKDAKDAKDEKPAAPEAAPVPAAKKIVRAPEKDEGQGGSSILAALPVLLAVVVFIALPQLAATGVNSALKLGLEVTSPGFQVITGAAKLCIIVAYMSVLRFTDMGKRMFQYHGAEHKSISAYEAQKPLEVVHARGVSALHARCGTTFIIMVAFVSVLVFSALGSMFGRALPLEEGLLKSVLFFFMKLPFIPVVAGITFEIQRLTARYCSTGPLRVFLWPGFLVQKITTAEPDDDQLEVAMASLRSALANASVTLPEEHPDQSFESYAALIGDPAYRVAS